MEAWTPEEVEAVRRLRVMTEARREALMRTMAEIMKARLRSQELRGRARELRATAAKLKAERKG